MTMTMTILMQLHSMHLSTCHPYKPRPYPRRMIFGSVITCTSYQEVGYQRMVSWWPPPTTRLPTSMNPHSPGNPFQSPNLSIVTMAIVMTIMTMTMTMTIVTVNSLVRPSINSRHSWCASRQREMRPSWRKLCNSWKRRNRKKRPSKPKPTRWPVSLLPPSWYCPHSHWWGGCSYIIKTTTVIILTVMIVITWPSCRPFPSLSWPVPVPSDWPHRPLSWWGPEWVPRMAYSSRVEQCWKVRMALIPWSLIRPGPLPRARQCWWKINNCWESKMMKPSNNNNNNTIHSFNTDQTSWKRIKSVCGWQLAWKHKVNIPWPRPFAIWHVVYGEMM
mmetsp:Transcript_18607/g.30838  ORF Transcript_18607/g.30838 Transcript_18607/m.30838 type:complete len:331 (+) Transcript_18607:532-1524(+)